MRKFLLTFAAFVVAMAASAQIFGSFEPVSESYELKNIKTTAAADGSVYVTSTYDKDFTFAGSEVAAPDFTSSCIVKYDATGAEQWVVTFAGAAEIFDIAADVDGTLYAAGHFAADVVCTGANGAETTISGDETIYTTFIAKINAVGEFEVVKTIAPEVSASILEAGYFPEPGYVYVTPSKIQVDGDKVYVAASFTADVPELGWVASYIDAWGWIMDNKNFGIFSLDKSDLENIASVATVKDSQPLATYGSAYYPEALSFAADNGKVYLGFFGWGNLTLTTAAGAHNFAFDMTGEGSTEHAFVLATIGATTTVKEFRVAKNDKYYIPFSLFMEVVGSDIVIAGTYFGELPFDTSIVTEESTALFVAKLAKDGIVKEAASFGEAYEPAACMGVGEVVLITAGETSYAYVAGQEVMTTNEFIYSDLCGNTLFVYTDDTKVCIEVAGSTVGVEDIVVENDSEVIYNLLGQPVDASYQGVVIKGGKLYIVK